MPPKPLDEKQIDEKIRKTVGQMVGFDSFRVIDTPTDQLAPVNKRFLTMNGVTGSRPTVVVTGQMYFDSTLGLPVWWNGSNWVNAAAVVV